MDKLLLTFAVALFIGIGSYTFNDYLVDFAKLYQAKYFFTDEQLKEKIGQMLIIGFTGTEVNTSASIAGMIGNIKPGGVILFSQNVHDRGQVKTLIYDLQSFSITPLFIAVDAEGGEITPFKNKNEFSAIPSAASIGSIRDLKKVESIYEQLSAELKDLGVNVNFAPVVDVNVNQSNPIIGLKHRSFSSDYKDVELYADIVIKSHEKSKIITSLKHFPGHGSSMADSHKNVVDVTRTYKKQELKVFEDLIRTNDIGMVMVGHIIDKNIDEQFPASISGFFIDGILRKQLNYTGVVISDDMQMKAITDHFMLSDAVIKAINAGEDMLIISNNGRIYDKETAPYKVVDVIFNAVKSGEIPIERIIESNKRISELKRGYVLDKK